MNNCTSSTYSQWNTALENVLGLAIDNVGWVSQRNAVGSGEELSFLKWRLNVEATAMLLSSRERLFQASGPDTENKHWPKLESTRGVL